MPKVMRKLTSIVLRVISAVTGFIHCVLVWLLKRLMHFYQIQMIAADCRSTDRNRIVNLQSSLSRVTEEQADLRSIVTQLKSEYDCMSNGSLAANRPEQCVETTAHLISANRKSVSPIEFLRLARW